MSSSRLRRPTPTLDKRGRPDKPARRVRPLAAAAFVVLLAVVTWGSLTPAPPSAPAGFNDKVQHFSAYLVLGLLGQLAAPGRAWTVAGSVVLFGLGVEAAQAIMALGREGSWLDALANTAGVALAALLVRFTPRR